MLSFQITGANHAVSRVAVSALRRAGSFAGLGSRAGKTACRARPSPAAPRSTVTHDRCHSATERRGFPVPIIRRCRHDIAYLYQNKQSGLPYRLLLTGCIVCRYAPVMMNECPGIVSLSRSAIYAIQAVHCLANCGQGLYQLE
jgi:hypothetical protein